MECGGGGGGFSGVCYTIRFGAFPLSSSAEEIINHYRGKRGRPTRRSPSKEWGFKVKKGGEGELRL